MGLEREGIKSVEDFFGKVSRGTEILPYARFGGGESLVAGEDDVTVQEVVRIVRVVEIVGVENIIVQREHVVECGIEGEVVAGVVVEKEVMEEEVVEEEVVEEVITKEVRMVNAVGLVEEEVFSGKALERPSRGSSW